MLLLIDMAPLYEEVCAELKWPVDKALLAKMQSKNQEKLEKLDETLKDTEENLGETEVRDALYDKAEYLCKIGEKVIFEEKKYFLIHYKDEVLPRANGPIVLSGTVCYLTYIICYLLVRSYVFR